MSKSKDSEVKKLKLFSSLPTKKDQTIKNTSKSQQSTTSAASKTQSKNGSKITEIPQIASTSKSKSRTSASPIVPKAKQPSTILLKPKQPPPPSRIEASTVKSKGTSKLEASTRRAPLRAVLEPKKPQPPPLAPSAHNVMNTVHNVTVISPPSIRKEYAVDSEPAIPRQRTRTRTLEPSEILVLPKSTVEQHAESDPVKDPVAFEVHFEAAGSGDSFKALKEPISQKPEEIESVDEDEYEDDFDSYESDFESYSHSSGSTSSTSPLASEAQDEEPVIRSDSLPRGSGRDQQFDSGLYDLKTEALTVGQQQSHSIPHIEEAEAQKDSGFGFSTISPSPKRNHPTENPLSKRSAELMSKIQLDTMSFSLFELKPMAYEHYMKLFGHANATQMASQTVSWAADQECQTTTNPDHTMWTQFPAQLSGSAGEGAFNRKYFEERLGCGGEWDVVIGLDDEWNDDDALDIEQSLAQMRTLSRNSKWSATDQLRSNKTINVERLSGFLQRASTTIASVIDGQNAGTPKDPSAYSVLDWQQHSGINGTKVDRIFGNLEQVNVLYTVHTSVESFWIAIWNTFSPEHPLHVLSSWSRVMCVEAGGHLVFAGLEDGCIALWNLTESRDCLEQSTSDKVCVPTHVVSPNVINAWNHGSIVAIRRYTQNSDQICSLHEYGLLTIWSLLHTSTDISVRSTNLNQHSIDHSSPWATVRLIQSHFIDLRIPSIGRSSTGHPLSAFDRTRSYFESNIFSDSALQELHAIDATPRPMSGRREPPSEALLCFDLILLGSSYFVATNRGVLITGTLSAHGVVARCRAIHVSAALCVHATRLQRAPNGRLALLVGLSDGSVKLVWCSNSDLNDEPMPDLASNAERVVNAEEDLRISGKSCAIQNIIREERRDIQESYQATNGVTVGIIENTPEICDSMRFWNQAILLAAHNERNHHVKWMGICESTNRLFALCHGELRQFDLDGMAEVAAVSAMGIDDAALVRNGQHGTNLALIEGDEVRIYSTQHWG